MSNKDEGFIMEARSMFDHWLWLEDREFSKYEAWKWLMKEARYSEEPKEKMINGRLIKWKRGQVPASIRFLQKAWNWGSRTKVTNFLEILEKEDMISIEKGQGQNVITLCNYSTYNPLPDEQKDSKKTRKRRGKDAEKTRKRQNSKKDNKGKKEIHTPPAREEVISYFDEKGYSESLANKFFDYYDEPMQDRNGRVWKDQNGNTVKSWKQKAIAVWMKDDNKKENLGDTNKIRKAMMTN